MFSGKMILMFEINCINCNINIKIYYINDSMNAKVYDSIYKEEVDKIADDN